MMFRTRYLAFLTFLLILPTARSVSAAGTGCHFLREHVTSTVPSGWKSVQIAEYFVIHFDPSGRGEDGPVEGLLERHKPVLERSKHFLQTELGWKLPSTRRELNRPQIFIYLVNAPEDFSGSVRTSPFLHIALNRRMLTSDEFPDLWMHQLSHAAQLEYGISAEYWFHEATAGWMETEFHGGSRKTLRAQQKRLSTANLPLTDSDPELALGGSRLLVMISRPNRDVIRQIWQQKAYSPEETVFQVLPKVLALNHLPDTDSYLQNYFLLSVPQASLKNDTTDIVLQPHSALVLSGTPDGWSTGGARLSFTSRNGEPFSASLLYFASGEERGTVSMQRDLRRSWSILVPYAGLDHYKMVLSNSSSKPLSGVLRRSYDSTVPAVLEYFRVQPGDVGIELEWKTAVENGVAFWNLYRIEKGRKVKLNQFPIPASLQSEGGIRYIYFDPEAGEFYSLEAITSEGFQAPLGSADVTP